MKSLKIIILVLVMLLLLFSNATASQEGLKWSPTPESKTVKEDKHFEYKNIKAEEAVNYAVNDPDFNVTVIPYSDGNKFKGLIEWDPPANWSGERNITITAYDDASNSITAEITITVKPVNDKPVVLDIPNQRIIESCEFTPFDLDDYVTDVDDLDSEINWTITNTGSKLNANIDDEHVVIITYDPEFVGKNKKLTFKAKDSGGGTNSKKTDLTKATFTVEVNEPPVIEEIPNSYLQEDSGLSDNLIDLMKYTSDLNREEQGDEEEGEEEASCYDECYESCDGECEDEECEAECYSSCDEECDEEEEEEEDEDHEPYTCEETLTFTILSESNSDMINCVIDSNQYIDCTTKPDMFGESQITIQVEDSGRLTDTGTFTVYIESVNDAPVMVHIEDVTVIEGDLVKIEPTATDVDGNTVKFTFTKPLDENGLAKPLDENGQWQTTSSDAGTYKTTITADDGKGGTATQEVTITVKEDLDGDNKPDGTNDDNFLYDPNKIDTNIESLSIIVGGSENTAQTFTGTQTIEIKEEEKLLVSFNYNFDAGSLNLLQLSITKQEENATQGSLIIKGITLTDTTKTAYLKDISASDYICIKDSEISSITEINENCDAEDETLIQCSEAGTAKNGYTCTDTGDYYKIEGLKHSGAKEIEFCGDGTCNNGEGCSSCSTDCGACPALSGGSGGGSSGGGRKIKIIEEIPCEGVSITCEEWNRCINLGRQDRSCEIIKDCNGQTRTNLEWEEQGCEIKEQEEQQAQTIVEEVQEEQEATPPITGAAVTDSTVLGLNKTLVMLILSLTALLLTGLSLKKRFF